MNEIKIIDFDTGQLRVRLRKMTDGELACFGNYARSMCAPYANHGKPPRDVFVMQLREAREE